MYRINECNNNDNIILSLYLTKLQYHCVLYVYNIFEFRIILLISLLSIKRDF